MKKIIALVLTVVMLASLTATVFARDWIISPIKQEWNVKVVVKDDKGGTATSSAVSVNDGDTVVIKAKPDDGFTFGGWTFTGDFDWVSGDANSLEIVIRPKGDVVFTATFNGQGPKKDNGGTSPVTGYNTEAAIAFMSVVVLVSVAAVAYTGKKYFAAK